MDGVHEVDGDWDGDWDAERPRPAWVRRMAWIAAVALLIPIVVSAVELVT
jgi:hypothetical protein